MHIRCRKLYHPIVSIETKKIVFSTSSSSEFERLCGDTQPRLQYFIVPRSQYSPTRNTSPTTGCRARSTSLWINRNLSWQLSRDGNLHGPGMSHTTTTSPKPFSSASWREGPQEKCQRVDVSAHARIARRSLLQKRL